jgi:hypothetical protein
MPGFIKRFCRNQPRRATANDNDMGHYLTAT